MILLRTNGFGLGFKYGAAEHRMSEHGSWAHIIARNCCQTVIMSDTNVQNEAKEEPVKVESESRETIVVQVEVRSEYSSRNTISSNATCSKYLTF